jgi:hypothetical protein
VRGIEKSVAVEGGVWWRGEGGGRPFTVMVCEVDEQESDSASAKGEE